MDEAVFIAQYTFLATPAVIEEESRILGKIARRLRCEYVIRFEDDGKFYFLLETRSGYEEHPSTTPAPSRTFRLLLTA